MAFFLWLFGDHCLSFWSKASLKCFICFDQRREWWLWWWWWWWGLTVLWVVTIKLKMLSYFGRFFCLVSDPCKITDMNNISGISGNKNDALYSLKFT